MPLHPPRISLALKQRLRGYGMALEVSTFHCVFILSYIINNDKRFRMKETYTGNCLKVTKTTYIETATSKSEEKY
jgi:hypothetical protein